MKKIIIAAMSKNYAIGKDKTLPWHIPEELKLFKKTTMGYPMIMGRKTFESLPGILPGRQHIVLTRDQNYKAEGADTVTSWQAALALCEAARAEKVFIIGGAEIFTRGLEIADELLLTFLHREVAGDVFFPEFKKRFEEVERQEYPAGTEPFTVKKYKKI